VRRAQPDPHSVLREIVEPVRRHFKSPKIRSSLKKNRRQKPARSRKKPASDTG
jgi:hypothetical protein